VERKYKLSEEASANGEDWKDGAAEGQVVRLKMACGRTSCDFTRDKHVEDTPQNPIKRNFRCAASVGTNETGLETVSNENEFGG
jgi:hypothetical protein